MSEHTINEHLHQRQKPVTGLFYLFSGLFALFLITVFKIAYFERDIPRKHTIIHDRALRGAIVSADDYTLAYSQKSYQAVIRKGSVAPDKLDLFVKLFTTYSGINEKEIRKKITEAKRSNIILSKTLNTAQAMRLKALAYKLRRMHVFQTITLPSGTKVLYGLDIVENGELRRYPLVDVAEPVVGYVRYHEKEGYRRPVGQKGIERKYDKYIASKKDGYYKGKRDVGGHIIHDKNSIKAMRVDGMSVHLNIPLALQRPIEKMIDTMKVKLDADEILVGVMESRSGKVLALASSERFNPSHITQDVVSALNPKFSEYPYEPGSVFKPITLALALEHRRITPKTVFNTYNGRMKIGKRRTITDDEKFASLSATDIIVHSSNVGISQISWKLTGKEFREGIIGFGFSKPSGIDLSRDLPGSIKPEYKLNHQLHRANSAYGYGLTATFAQLLKAYSAFNNDGIAVTPRIVDYLEDATGKHYILPPTYGNIQAVSKHTAEQVHEILKQVVARGTGRKAQYPGLEIGGKTGTAHIAKHGHYVREYHSSFYGFANDKLGHKYTIGVLVIRAKKWRKYFASQSAVPTFKNIVRILVEQGYLKPEETAQEPKENEPLYNEPETIEVAKPVLPPPPKPKKPTAAPKPKPQHIIKVKTRPKKPYRPPVKVRHKTPRPASQPLDLF
jgi:cell division protein FtsI (penicillin-binding protein 3)